MLQGMPKNKIYRVISPCKDRFHVLNPKHPDHDRTTLLSVKVNPDIDRDYIKFRKIWMQAPFLKMEENRKKVDNL